MKRRTLQLTLLGTSLLTAVGFAFGGWAVVTVEDLPDYAVAGKPINLAFAVRQHGRTLLPQLKPTISAQAGSSVVRGAANAAPGSATGHYAASLTLPHPGDWTITIHSGFGESRMTLLPIKA